MWGRQNSFSTEALCCMRMPNVATGREMLHTPAIPESPLEGAGFTPCGCPRPHYRTAPCSATAREGPGWAAPAPSLQLAEWFACGLPLHTYSGHTDSGKALLVPFTFGWVLPRCLFPHQKPLSCYEKPLLGILNYITNYNRYKTNIILCSLDPRLSKVTWFWKAKLPGIRYSSFPLSLVLFKGLKLGIQTLRNLKSLNSFGKS